nr:hypothetical protein [Tanacetum cinerariifolium]
MKKSIAANDAVIGSQIKIKEKTEVEFENHGRIKMVTNSNKTRVTLNVLSATTLDTSNMNAQRKRRRLISLNMKMMNRGLRAILVDVNSREEFAKKISRFGGL